MKILVTGGLGYIGSHISAMLGEKAVIIDDKSNSNLNFKKKLPLSKVYCQNLCKKTLQKIFSENKIDGVIHLAGYKAVNESIKYPLSYYRNNIISSLELLECMNEFKIRKLIFSSSATIYGNNHQSPLKENFSYNSINPYASSKITIEQMIKDYSNSEPKFKAISLRYFNPIGANIKQKLSENPLGKPQNIMPILVRAIKNKKNFKIFGNNYNTSDGTCIRDYIHVQDLADAHLIALKKLSKIKRYEAINLGLGKGISVLKIIEIFEKTNQVKIKFEFTERRKGDVAISFADTKKSKKLLNWKPKFSYEDMMRDSWQSFLINQND